jgi:hypothetical protein
VESGWLARARWLAGKEEVVVVHMMGHGQVLDNDDGVEVGEVVKWRTGDGEVGAVLWPLGWEVHMRTHTQRGAGKERRGPVCTLCTLCTVCTMCTVYVAEGAAGARFVSWRVGM